MPFEYFNVTKAFLAASALYLKKTSNWLRLGIFPP